MRTVIIDANAFLRYLLNDIPQQAEQVETLFEQAKKGKIRLVVPQIIIFEIAFALDKYYKFPKEVTISKLQSILSATFLQIQDVEIFIQGLLLYKRKSISLTDSFVLAKAENDRAEIFTFDERLKKII